MKKEYIIALAVSALFIVPLNASDEFLGEQPANVGEALESAAEASGESAEDAAEATDETVEEAAEGTRETVEEGAGEKRELEMIEDASGR